MRIAICDDNKDFDYNAVLKVLLVQSMKKNEIDDYEITAYTSGLELIKKFNRGVYDFIFLDIQMPKPSGFEVASHINGIDKRANIIFVTSENEYVYDCFKYGAKDFVCKPVSQSRIDEVMDRLVKEHRYQESDNLYQINLKSEGSTELYLPEILYFESKDNYVLANTMETGYTFRSSMEKVADDLKDKGFIRISRQTIVNKIHIFQYFKDSIVLETGEKLTIGRTYKEKIKKAHNREW